MQRSLKPATHTAWLDTWICIVCHILEMPSLVAVLQCAAGSGLHQAETLPSLDALEFMATFSACFPDAMMATGVKAAARACRQLLCSCPLQVCKKFPGSGNSSVPLAVFSSKKWVDSGAEDLNPIGSILILTLPRTMPLESHYARLCTVGR